MAASRAAFAIRVPPSTQVSETVHSETHWPPARLAARDLQLLGWDGGIAQGAYSLARGLGNLRWQGGEPISHRVCLRDLECLADR